MSTPAECLDWDAPPAHASKESAAEFWAERALAPAREFVGRSGKQVRARLVQVGAQLAGTVHRPAPATIDAVAEAVELVHAGSLIVDDVQDDSPTRRGAPAIHRERGIASAVGAGLWLTFAGLARVASADADPSTELALHRLMARSLERAARGQALDVGTRIQDVPHEDVAAVCLESMRCKAGALAALPLVAGATLCRAGPDRIGAIARFGDELGVALQMYNDLGNVRPCAQRRGEDLANGRPTWLFAHAAQSLHPTDYARFVLASRSLSRLDAFVCEFPLLVGAQEQADCRCATALATLAQAVGAAPSVVAGLAAMKRIVALLAAAY